LAPLTAEPVAEEDEKVQARQADPPRRVWRVTPRAERPRGPAWVVGTLFHEALRRWRFPGDAGFTTLMQVIAQERGLTNVDEIEGTIRRTERLLRRFQAHDLYAELHKARRLHEVPYTLQRGEKTHSGIIDLLVERNGRWTVIDFKTDRIEDEAALASPKIEAYRAQVREYMAAVAHLLDVAVEGQLCFLNVKGQIWIEAVSDA
jgi:ATP-dependent exoDNAse (exonuclease V) beta subunit